MQRKPFKSRLFKKTIKSDDFYYWFYLYAESLYRLKLNTELNCPCSHCWVERAKLNYILDQIEEEGHITPIKRKSKMTGKGDCGRRLGPVA
jgi:hypothetical protein